MTDKERITQLEQRLAALEGRLAVLEHRATQIPFDPMTTPLQPRREGSAGEPLGWPFTTSAAWIVDPQTGQISA